MEGVGSVVNKVEAYCFHEEQRIALTNQPKILAFQAEASLLLDEQTDLAERLRLAPPPGDLQTRRRKAFYYGWVAALLTVAAFVFSLYSFEPFRLGLKGYLYCLGIAVVTPFLVDMVIEWWKAETFIKSLATLACAASLVSLVLLAVIRGDLLAESVKDSNQAIVIDDAQSQTPQFENNFYDKTTPMLQLVMALLALAMELGAGLALHQSWRLSSEVTEDWEKLRKRLAEIRARLVALTFEITTLQNEARVFAERFWRNFYRAMLTHTMRSAMTKLLVAVVVISMIAHGYAAAQSHTTLVIAIDLSQSVAVQGPGEKSEFQKNIEAVTNQLAQVPADSRVTVVGITDHSFTQPDILLSAAIPPDPGYFGERLRAATQQLVQVWRTRSAKAEPRYPHTDIFGALLLAGQIFERQVSPGRKVLVIYSDMRHNTPQVNLESPLSVPRFAQINTGDNAIADLRNVAVYARGVDGAGKPIEYWESLRRFWTEYFRNAGAILQGYSVLRALPIDDSEIRK
jgi:cell division protein FtsB